MIVQSQYSGQLYEVPDGLTGYEEYYDPRLGLPFLLPFIPKIAALASKIVPAVASLVGGRPGGAAAAPPPPAVAVGPPACPPCPPCPPIPPPIAQPLVARRRRRRALHGVPGYGYYGDPGYGYYGWYGY